MREMPKLHSENVSKSLIWKKWKNARAWKWPNAWYVAFHSWLKKEYWSPKICEDIFWDCRWAKRIEYALITGKTHDHNRDNYLTLCTSCHRRYDMTPEKKEKIIKNLKIFWRDKINTKNRIWIEL